MRPKIEKYTAIVVQPEVTVAKTKDDIYKNLERYCQLIDFGVGYKLWTWFLKEGVSKMALNMVHHHGEL